MPRMSLRIGGVPDARRAGGTWAAVWARMTGDGAQTGSPANVVVLP